MDEKKHWRLAIHPHVANDMAGFSASAKQMILEKISEKLTQAPVEFGKRLRGDLHPLLRLRVGDYRVVYEVFPTDHLVRILLVGMRKSIYGHALKEIARRLES